MARLMAIPILSLLVAGCSTMSTVDVVNDTHRPIDVDAVFRAAEPDEKSGTAAGRLDPGQSLVVLRNAMAPYGDIEGIINGQRTEKASFAGGSFGESIHLRITESGSELDRGPDDPGHFARSVLISCIAAPFAAIALFFILGVRRASRARHATESLPAHERIEPG